MTETCSPTFLGVPPKDWGVDSWSSMDSRSRLIRMKSLVIKLGCLLLQEIVRDTRLHQVASLKL